MEFRPKDIARLVLGYLKDEKCQSAFSEFLTGSTYLKDHAALFARGKYFITRVSGLSLVDYLTEYAIIYTIVQERLEASEYYSEHRSRTTLVEQLLYLLNSAGIQSRTSTPIHHEHNIIRSPHRESTIKSNSADKGVQHIPDNSSNNSFERLCAGINTTSSQNLPGNSSIELSFLNNSKNKAETSLSKQDKSTNTDDEEQVQILTQTCLEKTDFIEKLAENINKEVLSKSSSKLDNVTIQSIVERTEADPAFSEILAELLDSANENDEDFSGSSPEKNEDDHEGAGEDLPGSVTPQKSHDELSSSNCLKQRLRSSKKLHTCPIKSSLIEEQNDDAIQSLIAAASLSTEKQPVEAEIRVSSATSSVSMEAMVPCSNYDTMTQTFTAPSNQNQVYANTSGLLMLQPNGTMSCSNVVSTRNVDPPKSCYIIGNQSFVNVPQTPLKVLTEQDILTMPTIFVCDNNPQPTNTQTFIVSQPAPTSSLGQNRLVNIAPKITPEKAQTLSEYITLYQCNDTYSSMPQVHCSPLKPKVKLKQIASTTTSKKESEKNRRVSLTEKPQISVKDEHPLQNFSNLSDNASQVTSENMAMDIVEADVVIQKPLTDGKHITPKAKVEKKETASRSTPRNGSHVRQLNFSTPEKWISMLRKSNTSPKLENEHKETSVKTIKTNTSKNIRTTLFKSPEAEVVPEPSTSAMEQLNKQDKEDGAVDTEVPETSTSKSNSAKISTATSSWDADLRALAGPTVPTKPVTVTQKQKRKRVEESPKQSNNSKKLKESVPNLNKTEEDALKIEMALENIGIEIESTEAATEGTKENTKNSTKTVNKRRDRLTTKKVISVKKTGKTSKEKQPAEKPVETIPNPPVDKLSAICVNIEEEMPLDSIENAKENVKKGANEQNSLENPYAVINRNMKSRIKKKCNMENTVKKTPVPEEVVLTNVTKIKSCEILDDGQNTLILSPSKLNANKRSLVEVETRSTISEQTAITKSTEENTTDGKVTTPELLKTCTNNPPLTAKYNMMPLLETPVKFDSIGCPKTPGIISTPIIDTPFTKAVIDQLTGVDINAIPTPKFPITPHFPFTPAHEQSPFSNRATDYSTSSSYYQPSDTEQNKSLEQLIEECRRLETQPVAVKSTRDVSEDDKKETESTEPPEKVDGNCQDTVSSSITTNKSIQKSENPEIIKSAENSSLHIHSEPSEVIKNTLMDKQKAFNHSMIGKKNLQLVKMLSENPDDSSSENSSSESDTSSSSSDCSCADADSTAPKDMERSRYSLRPRKATNNTSGDKEQTPQKPSTSKNVKNLSEEPQKPSTSKSLTTSKEKNLSKEPQKPSTSKFESKISDLPQEKVQAKPGTYQDGILKTMEQIRQRTIAKFKNSDSNTKKNDNSKKKKPVPKSKTNAKEIAKLSAVETVRQFQKVNQTKSEKIAESALPSTKDIDPLNKTSSDKSSTSPAKKQRKSDSPRKLKQPEILPQETSKLIHKNSQSRTNSDLSKKSNKQSEALKQNKDISKISLLNRRNSQESKLESPKISKTSDSAIQKQHASAFNLAHQSIQNETKVDSLKTTQLSKCPIEKEKPGTSKIKNNQSKVKSDSPKKPKQPQRSPQKMEKPPIKYITIKEARAMVDEEDDIILHLSSDEEDLEPFEMVETELLECSTSSTPIADEDRTNRTLDLLPNLNEKGLTEEKIDEVVDPEAESLVKGLKQWGIHLVPNKSTKKTSTSPETKGITVVEIGSQPGSTNSAEDRLKSSTTVNQEKTETLREKPNEKDKLNVSLEEGELVSDIENSPKKKIKPENSKAGSIKTSNLTHISQSRRNSDSAKDNRRCQNKEKSSKESHRSRSHSEGKSKELVASTSSSSSLVSKSKNTKSKNLSNKVTKTLKSSKAPEKSTQSQHKDKSKTINEKESTVNEDVDYQMEFDLRTYENETIRFTHDYSKKPSRKLTDYNLDILTKKFSASVYIAEIDSEVEKLLVFTPFEFLLDIPSKSLNTVPQKKSSITEKPSTSHSTQIQVKKTQNPLNILYNQLVKPATEQPRHSSPLDDLYSPEPARRENRKLSDESHRKISEKTTTKERIDRDDNKSSKSKQKLIIKEKTSNKEHTTHNKSSDRSKKDSALEQKHVKVTKNASEIKASKSTRNLSTDSSTDIENSTKQLTSDLEVVDGVIMLNSNSTDMVEKDAEDDLMNYALVGSERVENSEDSLTSENRKRKTTEGSDSEKSQEKKQKTEVCQELLRNIDVDSFLKQLHGET